jgi:hypothetical protein
MSTRTSQRLIVIVCGFIAQCIIAYLDNGHVQSAFALLTTCCALIAVHFSDEGKASLNQEKTAIPKLTQSQVN